MEKIFSDFVNFIKDCSTTIKARIYNNVYNKDMLYGIFADGIHLKRIYLTEVCKKLYSQVYQKLEKEITF